MIVSKNCYLKIPLQDYPLKLCKIILQESPNYPIPTMILAQFKPSISNEIWSLPNRRQIFDVQEEQNGDVQSVSSLASGLLCQNYTSFLPHFG